MKPLCRWVMDGKCSYLVQNELTENEIPMLTLSGSLNAARLAENKQRQHK